MDVMFVANDTRGGVEPYVALAAEAVARGHRVRVAAPPQYERDVVAIGAVFIGLHDADRAREIAMAGRVSLREMSRLVVGLTARWAADVAAHAGGTDVVVAGIGGMAIARPVARSVGAAFVRAHLQPLEAPSGAYPGPLASRLDALGPAGRRLSHLVTSAGTSMLTRAPEKAARDALNGHHARDRTLPTILYGFSDAVVPVVSDARTTWIATGWWSSPHQVTVDPALAEFVERPGPVVSIGFGSMVTPDPAALRALVTTAAREAETRVVMLSGWGALPHHHDDPGNEVLSATSIPHSWLFPRMTAIVHHGGAGTTGAALRAGVPSVVVPFGADQPFWGARLHRLRVAPRPIPRGRLTAGRLTAALREAVTDEGMRERARTLAATLGREGGVHSAVDILEAAVGRTR